MKLREWQEKAFPLWWSKKRGIIKVVTGGGKTFFAIHCLKKYLEKNPKKLVLIVVPSIALLDQWYENLSQEYSNKEISLNGGDIFFQKVDITSLNSVQKAVSKIINDHNGTIDFLNYKKTAKIKIIFPKLNVS